MRPKVRLRYDGDESRALDTQRPDAADSAMQMPRLASARLPATVGNARHRAVGRAVRIDRRCPPPPPSLRGRARSAADDPPQPFGAVPQFCPAAHACWAPSGVHPPCSPRSASRPHKCRAASTIRKRSCTQPSDTGPQFLPMQATSSIPECSRTRLRRSASRLRTFAAAYRIRSSTCPATVRHRAAVLAAHALPSSSECSRTRWESGISTAAGLTGGAISTHRAHVNIPVAHRCRSCRSSCRRGTARAACSSSRICRSSRPSKPAAPSHRATIDNCPHIHSPPARSSSRRRQRPASSGATANIGDGRRAAATRLGRRAASASDAAAAPIRHGVAVLARTRIRLRLRRAIRNTLLVPPPPQVRGAMHESPHPRSARSLLTTLPHLVPLAQVCSRASGRQPQTPVTPRPPQVWPIPAQFVRSPPGGCSCSAWNRTGRPRK